MTDTPWPGDACSLVDAFRSGERSPQEELDATFAAIKASRLNAFAHLDEDGARAVAAQADVSLPFGGVPTGIKELESVAGWPHTEASLIFKDRVASETTHHVQRLVARGGVVPVGSTTASEFGGLNVSVTKMNGVTHNPWRHGRTVGGSSSGSAAAVAGGLVSLATGGDGGGSIRIPAGYCGLLGFKGTFGRITRGPHAYMRPHTVVLGNPSRSVRDAARYYDVCAGVDDYDPTSLPSDGKWEANLGTHNLSGKRVAIIPNLGGVELEPGVEDRIRSEAKQLIAENNMVEVDIALDLPNLAAQWAMGNLATLLVDMGDAWPKRAGELTDELAFGMFLSQSMYNLHVASTAEKMRVDAGIAMARAFEQVDFIVAATNPGPAFAADATTSAPQKGIVDAALNSDPGRYGVRGLLRLVGFLASFNGTIPNRILDFAATRFPDLVNMGGLTIISNIYGNPAVSIPAGLVNGLPVGMQVLARRHEDALLFDVALAVERERPWPLVAPAT